ncbi:MAG TPA: hypothetical protein VFZ59_20740 [Verrucomicrobiae bacterium]|nr:hypothetical protein [Verrucomicrobiae bacterium]
MDAPVARVAWEPITPRGVAAFAHARLGRLLLVQFLVALVVGSGIAWLLHDGFFPAVASAIEQLPAQGEIRAGRLEWRGTSPQRLADGSFLSIAVDLEHSGTVRSLAHFQFEFGRTNLLTHSLLGYSSINYPDGWVIAFNRPELLPRWGAWRPVFLAAAILATVMYLMLSWSVLATLYFAPVWLLGFFANRDLTLEGSWRFCSAALMPGALAMLVAIFFYGIGTLDLVHMGFALAVHVVIGWIYLIVSIFYVPLIQEANVPRNPFNRQQKK